MQIHKRQWRRMSLLFLGLLPTLALFHLVMWFGFTRTLFRSQTGDLKRIGYLVGFEDRKAALKAKEPEPEPEYSPLTTASDFEGKTVPVMIFGDSFGPSLAKAYHLRTNEQVGMSELDWEQGNGISQIEAWLKDDWFRQHGVKTIVVERAEYEWLDTFADKGNPGLNISWQIEQAGQDFALHQKAATWTFANNGNFKTLFCNVAYLFSPTAFRMTDTCVVPLKHKFFDCSYGNRLLFYRGDLKGALTAQNQDRFDASLKNVQALSDLCRQQGMKFYLIVPPAKSYLYYDWVEKPFYPDSKMIETLQTRASTFGDVDLKQRFHHELESGYQDLYYPDDSHWNFPAAEMAAEELTKAESRP